MRTLFAFVGLFFLALAANGQTDTTTQKLEEVLIQENRIQLPFSKQNRSIVLLDRRQLEVSPAKSLNEVLSFVPGVDVRQRGVAGVQADVGIRGGSFEQTLLLLNGIKLSDPQTGHHLMNIPIPLVGIDRVEVLKGPASRIFGQNAFTGAINVITRLAEVPSLRLQSYGGSFGSAGLSVAGALPIGNYRITRCATCFTKEEHKSIRRMRSEGCLATRTAVSEPMVFTPPPFPISGRAFKRAWPLYPIPTRRKNSSCLAERTGGKTRMNFA